MGNATTMNSGFIVLEHDLFQQSVEVATGYILPDALAHQPAFRIEPVISCLNKPLKDAYVETNDNATNPPIGGGAGHSKFFAIVHACTSLACQSSYSCCDTIFWRPGLSFCHWCSI